MHRLNYGAALMLASCAAVAHSANADKGDGLKITKPPPRNPRVSAAPKPDPAAQGGGDPSAENGAKDRDMPPSAAKVVHHTRNPEEVDETRPHFLDETGPRGRVITLVMPAPRDAEGKAMPGSSTSTHEEVLPHGAPDVATVETQKDTNHPHHGKDAASAKKRLKERWLTS